MHRYALIGIVVKLFLGSANYFAAKVINSTCGTPEESDEGNPKKCPAGQTPFNKAFFITLCNFISLSLTIWIFYFIRRPKLDKTPYTRRNVLLMAIPGTIEACAFCLATSAQILMALSLAMIMKGAKVVFSALFTVLLFRRQLPWFKWLAVTVCLGGLSLAGSSEYMNQSESGDAGTILIGLCMSLASEAMFAFQVIFDERMMKRKNCDPTFIVGMEGVYGTLFLLPVVFIAWLSIPGKQAGSYENLSDTFYRVGESGAIIGFLIFYLLDIFVVAVADATITKYLSGVHSSLVSVGRTIVVWMLELVLFYGAPESISKMYGQKWDVYSPLKVVGFVIVVAAIFMYDGIIRVPGFDYSSIYKKPEVQSLAKEPTSDDLQLVADSDTTGSPVVLDSIPAPSSL